MQIVTFRLEVMAAVLVAPTLLGGCLGSPSSQMVPTQRAGQTVGAAASRTGPTVPSIALPEILRSLRPQHTAVGPRVAGGNGHWIYTAQLYGDDLGVYRKNGTTLSFFESLIDDRISQPQGTVATVNGWWYVANGGDSNVLIYKTTNKGPVYQSVLHDPGQFPGNVDVTPSRRLVAVSNVATTSLGPGSVSVYLDRAIEPARTLTYGTHSLQGIGVAIDHQGNCYWSFNDLSSSGGAIVEFAGCRGDGTPIITGIGVAGGLVFDQRDDLYYVDQEVGIYKCSRVHDCKTFATGFGDPVNINFDHKQKNLWVADATGYIDAVNPKDGKIESVTPAQGGASDPPFGVAAAPGG
jgi:DNA-binding beta-propeller fold protein YncE